MHIDRSCTVNRYDGNSIWVAPSSLKVHGLRNGQTLTREEWAKLGIKLAAEWVDYVQACEEHQSQS